MAIRLYADQRIDTLYPDKDQPVSSESALVHIDDMPQNGHVAGYQWYTQGDEIGNLASVSDEELEARIRSRLQRLGLTPPAARLLLSHEPAPAKSRKANGDATSQCHTTDD